jgi:hypothetical protein
LRDSQADTGRTAGNHRGAAIEVEFIHVFELSPLGQLCAPGDASISAARLRGCCPRPGSSRREVPAVASGTRGRLVNDGRLINDAPRDGHVLGGAIVGMPAHAQCPRGTGECAANPGTYSRAQTPTSVTENERRR